MDFNSILQRCYKKRITPFVLYSTMLDFCKGDLELKEQVCVLYKLYKQRDIFDEISLCEEEAFGIFLEPYPQKERDCLKSVARLIHPGWIVEDERKSLNKQKVKIQRVISKTTKAPQKVFLKQTNNAQRQVITHPKLKVQNNNGVQFLAKYIAQNPKKMVAKHDIEIKSLLSDVIVLIDSNVTDIDISVYNTGKWCCYKGGIIRRKTCTYINVEEVVAEKIKIVLPKAKYARLKLYKVSGDLTFIDKGNCFEEVSIFGSVGKIDCYTSAKSIYASTGAGNINIEYVAMQDGKIDLRNTLGDVSVQTFFVRKIEEKLFSKKGAVQISHKQIAGHNVMIKVNTKCGNINVS